jgi:hypothetical protein
VKEQGYCMPCITYASLHSRLELLGLLARDAARTELRFIAFLEVQQSDELVRAANARAEASDKARRKMQRKLDRILAQVKRRSCTPVLHTHLSILDWNYSDSSPEMPPALSSDSSILQRKEGSWRPILRSLQRLKSWIAIYRKRTVWHHTHLSILDWNYSDSSPEMPPALSSDSSLSSSLD